MTLFIHITSFTKNDKKYAVSYIYDFIHLFHKIPHIRDDICIKSVTFGPSQKFEVLCFWLCTTLTFMTLTPKVKVKGQNIVKVVAFDLVP